MASAHNNKAMSTRGKTAKGKKAGKKRSSTATVSAAGAKTTGLDDSFDLDKCFETGASENANECKRKPFVDVGNIEHHHRREQQKKPHLETFLEDTDESASGSSFGVEQ